MDSGVVNQVVGISNHSGDGSKDMVVNLVELSRLSGWDEELARLLLLSAEDHSVLGQDTDDRSILVDVLNGILNLEQATIWVKGGSSTIVLVRLYTNF